MKEQTRNFLVGVFVLCAVTVLGILMVWFGETPRWLQRGEWTLRIIGVNDIRGIGEGSPVILGGVEIGRVSGLSFEDPQRPGRGVAISAKIKQRFTVPQGSFAKVYGSMLGIGSGRIQILGPPEEAAPLDKTGTPIIAGEMASMLAEVISQEFTGSFNRTLDHIGNLAAAATPVAESLAKLMEERPTAVVDEPGAIERGATPNLSTAIERFDRLLANLNDVLGDVSVQGDVKGVASDLRVASEKLKQTVELWNSESRRISDNVNDGIDRTDESLQTALTRLTEVADHLDRGAANLEVITTQVAQGKGTAGKLVNDPRLYEAATLSFDRLSEFLATLNRIAGKVEEDGYITVGQKTVVGTFTKELPVGSRVPSE